MLNFTTPCIVNGIAFNFSRFVRPEDDVVLYWMPDYNVVYEGCLPLCLIVAGQRK